MIEDLKNQQSLTSPSPTPAPTEQEQLAIKSVPAASPTANSSDPVLDELEDQLSKLFAKSNASPNPSPSPAPEHNQEQEQEQGQGQEQALIDSDPLFTDEDIQALQDSSLLGGVVTRNQATSSPQGTAAIAEEELPQEEEEQQPGQLFSGQARGYTMLYLMQPQARATVNAQVQNMIDAQLEHMYLAVLTDGTFDQDFNFFASVVRRLAIPGARLTLVVYVTNGSTMRRFGTTNIIASFNQVDPNDFREQIRNDPATQSQYRDLVNQVLPILELNTNLNNSSRNFISPMLEDNLDDDSYEAISTMTREILTEQAVQASVLRNPCLGCFQGNTAQANGDPREFHDPEAYDLFSEVEGFSLDGLSYRFDGESGNALSISEVEDLMQLSIDRQTLYFGLWRTQRQGIVNNTFPVPSLRQYEVPSSSQLAIERELLRHGLEVLAN